MTTLLLTALGLTLTAAAEETTAATAERQPQRDCVLSCLSMGPIPRVQADAGFKIEVNSEGLERLATGPDLGAKMSALPGVTLDSRGRIRVRDMRPEELAVVVDGIWMPGTTIGGDSLVVSRGVTPVERYPTPGGLSIR